MASVRSIVWIGRGESFAAELAAQNPSVDIVWESNAERAMNLPLEEFDGVIVACDAADEAFAELATLSENRALPPVLVCLDSAEAPLREKLLAGGAADVWARDSVPSPGATAGTLLKRLEALARRAARRVSPTASPAGRDGIVGDSPQMREVLALVGHASRSGVTVLLTGETGTGKEILARALHHRSARRRRPFVAINCAAFPETLLESELFGHKKGAFTGADRDKIGLFEAASGGTLFLDEVGETSKAFQAKLLRVLQEREVRAVGSTRTRSIDVRVVAATNRDLRREAAEARFRADLYYRLAVFPIHVPPLRERPQDVLPLAEHFLALHGERNGVPTTELTRESANLLQSYGWPGNVRELENAIQRALTVAAPEQPLRPAHFSEGLSRILEPVQATIQPGDTLRETLGRIEAWLIRRALQSNGGRRATTARGLGITREGLYKKMQRLNIE